VSAKPAIRAHTGVDGPIALYQWAPDRDSARRRWVSPGALLATAVWLVASIGFSIYAAFAFAARNGG
jgi:uncharacterized BrkB/YihY/UPF0761 family membrane protein